MSRETAIERARRYFETGGFLADLDRRVAFATESQRPRGDELARYLRDEIAPCAAGLGFTCEISPARDRNLILVASRIEDAALPTVLLYGHGDVVGGMEGQWSGGLDPWRVTRSGDCYYGRGTADNKGQHTIVLAALAEVLAARGGRLGFNTRLLVEMGEEIGSPGLGEFVREHRAELAADALIASDGPRLDVSRPTLFLGARGIVQIELSLVLRPGGNHSGNWGGLLANPATILAAAIATLVNQHGHIQVPGLKPTPMPNSVRAALAGVEITPGPDDPVVDRDWGEPGLTPAERVFGWNSLDLLAISCGGVEHPVSVARPVNAIPGRADAVLQLRYVVGTDVAQAEQAVRRHLDAHGFRQIEVKTSLRSKATRLDPDDPWVRWAVASIETTTGAKPAVLPNFGGSLPNDVFAETLGLKTLWVPHSYPGCSQHAPNEHLLGSVAEESLRIMAGLFWDLGEVDGPVTFLRRRATA